MKGVRGVSHARRLAALTCSSMHTPGARAAKSAAHAERFPLWRGTPMMRAAPALGDKKDGIPVFVTAQYPEKLGNTVEALKPYIKPRTATVGSSPDSHVVGKKRFSMVVPEIQKRYGKYPDRKQALLVGLEAHVCVLQTALDLLADGFEVFVLTDGVSSRDFADRSAAFRRMEAAGCVLATSEMALFEMLGGADSKGFKAVSALVKEAKPQPPMPSV